MKVKIFELYNEKLSQTPLHVLELNPNEISDFVKNIEENDMEWETTNENLSLIESRYCFLPDKAESGGEIYFKIIVERN
jgi:hypothetical protein